MFYLLLTMMFTGISSRFSHALQNQGFKKYCLRNTRLFGIESDVDAHGDSYIYSAVEKGHVYFVATPIGNLGDISKRAIDVLSRVDVICAEDTRHTKGLLRYLNLSNKTLLSHHEFNYKVQIPKIISMAKLDNSIAVVSDAGTPGISDPGRKLFSFHSVLLSVRYFR